MVVPGQGVKYVFFAVFLLVAPGWGQEEGSLPDSIRISAPDVYIDCSYCDLDYIRTEVTFANYVRDRKQADVHILISRQPTGGGGSEHTLDFIGQKTYSGMCDTLRYISEESDSNDDIRNGIVRTIKIGLMRFVARTRLADYIKVEYTPPEQVKGVKDRWNYWVFEIGINSWINGERSYREFWGSCQLSARRVTEESKIALSLWSSYDEKKYDYEDYKVTSITRGKGWDGSSVLSISDHWSAGYFNSIYSDDYSNRDIDIYNAAALEYNIFPYSRSTRRQLRLIYRIGNNYVDYTEETIFNKTSQWLFSERFLAAFTLIQPWGSVYTSLSGVHYFYDFRKNNVQIYSELSLKLYQGFSINITGMGTRVHDQISLAKGELSREDVLLRRKEMATSYQYWASIGISYSFGSIYNNIVNPRFGN
jgi:hypothetical protein